MAAFAPAVAAGENPRSRAQENEMAAETIRIGIVGWGNLGRGAELAAAQNRDVKVVGVFTRRDPKDIDSRAKAYRVSDLPKFKKQIDVLLLCGGSATDLPEQAPQLAGMFNAVCSFDTHAKIPAYFKKVDAAARKARKLAVISTGWDPGLFSLARLLGQSVLPKGKDYTFWGHGVSQGHSDAIRRVPGVEDAVQYTVPIESAVESVRAGKLPELSTREKHKRLCYVVAKEGADRDAIRKAIVEMPNYFADYDTTVEFVRQEELDADHQGLPHGGFVLRSGATGGGTTQLLELRLQLGSNPEFTASVMLAYARAVHRMRQEGRTGAMAVFDVPFGMLSPLTPEKLRKALL
jgi:diaminopimelate dehydrogenase